MSGIRFSSLLGYFGVLGGVAIALGLPWLILSYGQEISGRARL